MAEAVLRHLGGGRFEAFSAGSHPAGFVHPLALATLRRMHVPADELASKSWDEFVDAPFDAVITLCDAAAGRSSPIWKGSPVCVHWSLPDPVSHPGTEEDRIAFGLRVAERLHIKITGLVDLDWGRDAGELKKRVEFLGEI